MKSSIKLHPGRWAIGLIALMTVALVACGGSSEPAAEPAASEVSKKAADVQLAPTVGILATSVPAVAAAKPTPTLGAVMTAKDTVRIITSEEANTLGASSNNCVGNIPNTICDDWISDPLTWVDNKTFEIVPLSPIEGWEQLAPDRWQFKLREGVTFHSGNEWNSEHAAFWISYFGDEETSGHSNSNDFSFHGVFKGEAVDPLTLDIVCKNPCPILPRTTIFTKFMDKDWWEAASEDERETNTMGLGPYKLVDWRRGVEVEMEAFDGYKPNVAADSSAPSIKHAFQIWRNEPLVRAAMLQADEADWAEITLDDRDRVPQFKVATNNEVYLYNIDTMHHPELKKREVRLALNLAIDCDTLMAELYDDLLKCYGNIAQTGTVGITPENSAPYGYDPDQARQLLKDAGYDPANKITLSARSQKVVKDVEYAEAVVSYWKEVGINAELNIVESGVHSNIGRSNCGHKVSRADFMAAAGALLEDKCRTLGPGTPNFASMNLSAPATSTESLDYSRQGILRNSCFSRSSGVCEQELQEMIKLANETDTGPLRTERQQAVADHAREHVHFVVNFQNVVVYGLSKDLQWDPYYAPRIRPNTMSFK